MNVFTGKDVLSRARSAIGHGTIYALGRGGMDPDAALPWDGHHGLDCSGFAAWCLGVSRRTTNPWYVKFNGGWFETSAIFRDCALTVGMFDSVPLHKARPGMLYVFGDRKDAMGVIHQGHVGIVSRVDGLGPTHVIHCSHGNWARSGGDAQPPLASADAIAETTDRDFAWRNAAIAKPAWIEYEP